MSKDPYGGMVREFHEAFGITVLDTPNVGTPEERVLRVRLMLEEVLEFARAANVEIRDADSYMRLGGLDDFDFSEGRNKPDLFAMAHELADVAYVTHGTAVQLGIPLLVCTEEVHNANLRKLGPDGKPNIDERGKVRKPEGWMPANVGAVLKRLSEGEE